MSGTYKDRITRKAERLAEISAELDSLHAQATRLLGGPHDPHEGVILGQLGEARRALAAHLPAIRAALGILAPSLGLTADAAPVAIICALEAALAAGTR